MSQYKTKVSNHYEVFIYYARQYMGEKRELPEDLVPGWNGQVLTLCHPDPNVCKLAGNTLARIVKQYYFQLYTNRPLDNRQKEEIDKLIVKKTVEMLTRNRIMEILQKIKEHGNDKLYFFYLNKISAPYTVGFILLKNDREELEAALNPRPKEMEEVRPFGNEIEHVMDLDDKGIIRAYLLKLLRKPEDFDVRLKGVHNRLVAVGKTADCKNYQRFIKQSFNKMTICIVQIDRDTHMENIDKLRDEMPSFLGTSIFSEEQLLECCNYFEENFKITGPKQTFKKIKQSKESFIFVCCYEIYKEKVKKMISKYLMQETSSESEEQLSEDSIQSPRVNFVVENTFISLKNQKKKQPTQTEKQKVGSSKAKYVQKQAVVEIEKKGERELEKRQRREDMDRLKHSEDEDDGFIKVTKPERNQTKKIISSITINQNQFDEKDFSNWFYNNKVINPHDMIQQEVGDKITISLTAFNNANKQQLVKSFQMYFNFDRLVFLKKEEIDAANKFVEHFKKINPSCTIKVISGFCPYKYDELQKNEVKKKMYVIIQKDNIKKGGHNIHEFMCVIFKGLHNLGNLIDKGIEDEINEIKKEAQRLKVWRFGFNILIPELIGQPKIKAYCQKIITDLIEETHMFKIIGCKWQGTTVEYRLSTEESQQAAELVRKQIDKIIVDKFTILPLDSSITLKQLEKIYKIDERKYQLAEYKNKVYVIGLDCESQHYKIQKRIENQEETQQIVLMTYIFYDIKDSIDRIKKENSQLNITYHDNSGETIIKIRGFKKKVQNAFKEISDLSVTVQSNIISVESNKMHNQEIKVLNSQRILEKLAQQEKVQIEIIDKSIKDPTIEFPNGSMVRLVNKSASNYDNQNITIAMDTQTWGNLTDDDIDQAASCQMSLDGKVCYVEHTTKLKEGLELCQTDHLALIPNQESMQNLIYKLTQALMALAGPITVAICCRGSSNFDKAINVFEEAQKNMRITTDKPTKVTTWSWIEGRQSTPYNDKVNELLNKAVEEGKDVVYIDEKALGMTEPTHTFNKTDVTLTYSRTGDKFNVTKKSAYYYAQVNGVQYKINQSSVIDSSKENLVPIIFMVYRVNLKQLKQVNVFTEYSRDITKDVRQMTTPVDLSSCKFNRNPEPLKVVSVKINKKDKKRGMSIIQKIKSILEEERSAKETFEFKKNVSTMQKIKEACNEHGIRQEVVKETANEVVITFTAFSKKDIELIKHMYQSMTKTVEEVQYPSEWVRPKEEISVHLVPRGSKQFQDIEQVFMKSTGVPINELKRVENRIIWRKYQGEKKMLEEVTGIAIKEEMLFHGTRKNDPANIYQDKQEAFNINYSGDNNYFGRGIYFAREARYSQNYHYINKGERIMLYCRVLVGQSHVRFNQHRSNSIKDTEYRDIANKIRYESNFSNYDGSDIYIIYKSRRAYPSYIISY